MSVHRLSVPTVANDNGICEWEVTLPYFCIFNFFSVGFHMTEFIGTRLCRSTISHSYHPPHSWGCLLLLLLQKKKGTEAKWCLEDCP